jgi:hypothetical protein
MSLDIAARVVMFAEIPPRELIDPETPASVDMFPA